MREAKYLLMPLMIARKLLRYQSNCSDRKDGLNNNDY